jgi:hypothetical protein
MIAFIVCGYMVSLTGYFASIYPVHLFNQTYEVSENIGKDFEEGCICDENITAVNAITNFYFIQYSYFCLVAAFGSWALFEIAYFSTDNSWRKMNFCNFIVLAVFSMILIGHLCELSKQCLYPLDSDCNFTLQHTLMKRLAINIIAVIILIVSTASIMLRALALFRKTTEVSVEMSDEVSESSGSLADTYIPMNNTLLDGVPLQPLYVARN